MLSIAYFILYKQVYVRIKILLRITCFRQKHSIFWDFFFLLKKVGEIYILFGEGNGALFQPQKSLNDGPEFTHNYIHVYTTCI